MLNSKRSVDDAVADVRRMRAAAVLDVTISMATLALWALGVAGISHVLAPFGHKWSILLPFPVVFAGSALLVGVMTYLARRGQTIGLYLTGLHWASPGSRSSRRLVLGEPQFWCAALPAVYILLNAPLNIAIQWNVPVYRTLPTMYLFPLLVIGAVVVMTTCRLTRGPRTLC